MYDRNKFSFMILTAFVFLFCIFGLGVSASYSATDEDLKRLQPVFDIHFSEVNVKAEDVLHDDPRIVEDSTSITNINFEFKNKNDVIVYEIDALNSGNLDGEIATLLITNPVCNNQELCKNVVKTLTYEDGRMVKRGDTFKSYSSSKMYLTFRYIGDDFDKPLSVEKISLSINYMEG